MRQVTAAVITWQQVSVELRTATGGDVRLQMHIKQKQDEQLGQIMKDRHSKKRPNSNQ